AWEDEHLLVVDKPAGLAVHPGAGRPAGTLVHGLLARGAAGGEDPLRPGIVHRLDRDTSGVILFAKEDEAHVGLARQFEKREVEKTYLAIVKGQPGMDEFEVNLPLGTHPKNRLKIAVRPEGGSPARTRFRVLERYRRFSLVEASPATGRTHQIRVHLQAFGNPVAADPLYSGASEIFPSDVRGVRQREGEEPIATRTQLHAARIEFVHPMTGEELAIDAPLPADMKRLLGALERDRQNG
ncbi:MAG: RluA family pseudouridine synthase, partial [Planctomycetes bacterium]|nr:RluA family pseudouridine synthase [Planctomycetota bacterium]